MSRSRRLPFVYVMCLAYLWCLYGGVALAEGAELAADASCVRIWVRPLAYQDSPHAQAEFALEEVISPEATLNIPCKVSVSAELKEPRIRLYVFDQEGALLFEGTNPLDGFEGAFDSLFVWPLEDVEDGIYRARVAVVHALGETVVWREVLLEKRTYGRIAHQCESLSQKMRVLEETMQQGPKTAAFPAYSLMRAALASDASQRAERLLHDGEWPRASATAEYSHFLADSTRALLTFASLVPEIGTPAQLPSPTELEVHDGAFFSSLGPVFLLGLHDPAMNPRSLSQLKRYGLNFASIDVSPRELLRESGVKDDVLSTTGEYLAKADKLGIGVTVGLRTETAPAWCGADTAGTEDTGEDSGRVSSLEARQARSIGKRQIEALASLLAKHPSVNGVSLTFEPQFRWDSESVRRGFVEAVARKYDNDRRAVNRIWRTRLSSLDEIEVLWDYDRVSYQYDWQSWHQYIVSDHFAWLAEYADKFLPGLPKQITLPPTAFEVGEARKGINREALAGITDVTGCTAHYEFSNPVYAIPFPHPEISYRLLRSLAPHNPLVVLDAEFDLGSVQIGAPASRYLHTAMWEAAIAGVNGCALAPGGIWQRPGALEGFCAASLDLNRLGKIVTGFQRAEAPIAVLWSMSSKIYRDGETFLDSVRRAYAGCAFFGFPIRFITESECTPAGLEDVAVLVLPEVPALADETFEAINAYAKAGGIVIRSGRPAPYTPTGGARHDVIAQTDRTIFMRASDTSTVFLHALDAAYVFGGLPSIPRTINNHGYPLEGVKSRYIQQDSQEYLYVVNLRKQPVKAHLFGRNRQGRDLIRGRNVQFPMMLDPLDPMLICLDAVESSDRDQERTVLMAGEGAEAEGAPQPVVLKPVTR
ncbi:MAG: hypothetical protein R6V12_14290 [Candidatus Hydrogenedentota bacterium]